MKSTNFSNHRLHTLESMSDYLIENCSFLLDIDVDLTLSDIIEKDSEKNGSNIFNYYRFNNISKKENIPFFDLEVNKLPRNSTHIKNKSGLYGAAFKLCLNLGENNLEPVLFKIPEHNTALKTFLERNYKYAVIAKHLYGDKILEFTMTAHRYVFISPNKEEFLIGADDEDIYALEPFLGVNDYEVDKPDASYSFTFTLKERIDFNEYSVEYKVINDLEYLGINYHEFSLEDIIKMIEMVKI